MQEVWRELPYVNEGIEVKEYRSLISSAGKIETAQLKASGRKKLDGLLI